MIEGTTGRLGKGKTLLGVLKAYERFCEGETVFSNIPLAFPHVPIKTPFDFIKLRKGYALLDEWWADADNRKSNSPLNNLTTVIALRSRKQRFNIFYTQQFMQIDCRIAYITDFWDKPICYPFDPTMRTRLAPEILLAERWDGDFKKLPTEKYEIVQGYLDLYDTEKDPYTVERLVNETEMREAMAKALQEEPDLEAMYNRVTEISKIKDKREMLATL